MLCITCSHAGFIANIGVCKNCKTWTSSGMFTLCPRCSREKNLCEACQRSPELVANLVEKKKASMTHFPYYLRLNRGGRTKEELQEQVQKLTDNLPQKFPEIQIHKSGWLTRSVTVFIPKDRLDLLEPIQKEYDCTLTALPIVEDPTLF